MKRMREGDMKHAYSDIAEKRAAARSPAAPGHSPAVQSHPAVVRLAQLCAGASPPTPPVLRAAPHQGAFAGSARALGMFESSSAATEDDAKIAAAEKLVARVEASGGLPAKASGGVAPAAPAPARVPRPGAAATSDWPPPDSDEWRITEAGEPHHRSLLEIKTERPIAIFVEQAASGWRARCSARSVTVFATGSTERQAGHNAALKAYMALGGKATDKFNYVPVPFGTSTEDSRVDFATILPDMGDRVIVVIDLENVHTWREVRSKFPGFVTATAFANFRTEAKLAPYLHPSIPLYHPPQGFLQEGEAADVMITFFLGTRIKEYTDPNFSVVILSNDNYFESVRQLLVSRGVKAFRVNEGSRGRRWR
jgi:hypothetical protein